MDQQKAYMIKKITLMLSQCKFMFTDPQSLSALAQIEKLMKYLTVEAKK
jgi:hypothetical protein